VVKDKSEARFVLMPEYVVTDQGSRRYVDANELMEAYEISPYQIATTDQHKAIWLGPRQNGDYKEHLATRLKARGYT
jgi:hypothetical protein